MNVFKYNFLLVLFCVFVLFFYVYSNSQIELILFYFTHFTYSMLLATLILWSWFAIRLIVKNSREQFLQKLKRHMPAALLVILATLLLFLLVPAKMRIFADEVNLIADSLYLSLFHQPLSIKTGVWLSEGFFPLKEVFPSRPPLYAMLLSLLHTLFGYQFWNTFLLNFFLTLTVLFLLIDSIREMFQDLYITILTQLSLLLAVVSIPIFSLTATSGAIDLLFIALLFLNLKIFHHHTKTSVCLSSPDWFCFHLFSLLLLSFSRYEAPLFAFLIFLAIHFSSFKKLKDLLSEKSTFRSLLFFWCGVVLFLFTPYLWQRHYYREVFTTFTSDAKTPMRDQLLYGFFSFHYFTLNVQKFLQLFFLNFSGYFPYPAVANLLGLLSLPFCCKRKELSFPMICTLVLVLTYTLFFLSYAFGSPESTLAARFYILAAILLAPLPLFTLHNLMQRYYPSRKMLAPLIFFLLACWNTAVYFPKTMQGSFFNDLFDGKVFYYSKQILESSMMNPQKGFKGKLAILSDYPVYYSILGYSSFDLRSFVREKGILLQLLEKKIIDSLIVIEESPISLLTRRVPFEYADLLREVVIEKQLTPSGYLLISKFKRAVDSKF